MAKKRTSLGAVSLGALNAKIDRKKLSLREQTLRAERRVKATGVDRQAAMIAVARDHIASQPKKSAPAKAGGRRKKVPLRPKRPRSPFAGQRRPDPKKITRRGGRQPRKR